MAMIGRSHASIRPGGLLKFACVQCLWLSLTVTAMAQSSPPAGKLTLQSPLDQKGPLIVKDALGRPCLDIEAAARPQRINDKILDHVVSILNRCPRNIKIKVCYVGSQDCKEFVLQGYKREDTILGSMMGVSYFKYVVTQQ